MPSQSQAQSEVCKYVEVKIERGVYFSDEDTASTNNVAGSPAILTCKETSFEFKELPVTPVFVEQAEACCRKFPLDQQCQLWV